MIVHESVLHYSAILSHDGCFFVSKALIFQSNYLSKHHCFAVVVEIPKHEDREVLGILHWKPCNQIEGSVRSGASGSMNQTLCLDLLCHNLHRQNNEKLY